MKEKENSELIIKVSICCLAYNHEAFIKQCLDGFLMQQTDFDFEILIHDDSSTDKTAAIIREYEKQFPQIIKPVYQKNNKFSKEGQGMNIRYNFPRAKGEFIAICEGDDYWTDPLKLQKQVDFLKKNLDYVVYTHNSHFSNETFSGHKTKLFSSRRSGEIEFKDICPIRTFHTASILFRKKALDSLDVNFLSEKVKSGDKFLFMHLWIIGNIYYDKTPMAVYRRNAGGMSQSKNLNRFMDADIKMYEYFKNLVPKEFINELEEAKNYFKLNRFNFLMEKTRSLRLVYYYLSLIPIAGRSKHLPYYQFKKMTRAFFNKMINNNG